MLPHCAAQPEPEHCMKKITTSLLTLAAVAGLTFTAFAKECCDKAKAADKTCLKCHPEAAKTCCEKAEVKGAACTHPCCVEATKAGKTCEKCNPPAKKEEPKKAE